MREKGALSRDVFIKDGIISIPKFNSFLSIKHFDITENVFQIGSYAYTINSKQIDLQDILTNPRYWLGNAQLVEFTGVGIFRWFRKSDVEKDIDFSSLVISAEPNDELRKSFAEILLAKEISILGLHYATVMLQSSNLIDNEAAIEYFSEILRDVKSTHFKLAVEIANRPTLIDKISIKRKMFLAALQSLRKEQFRKLLNVYTSQNHELLAIEVINAIVNVSRGNENLIEIEAVVQNQISSIVSKSNHTKTAIPKLFELLVIYGVNHPSSYERIRRFFLQYELYGNTNDLRTLASKSRIEIRKQFTVWLGEVQQVAIDF